MIDIALITTNWSEERFTALIKASKIDGTFNKKIMSVDILDNGKINPSRFEQFKETGWTVINHSGGSRSGMILNQINALNHCESEWVLVMEDDIIINGIPNVNILDSYNINWLCYNCHINNDNRKINIKNLYLGENILRKPVEIADKWLLTFPAAVTKRNLLLSLHEQAFKIAKESSIEEGLSIAWKNGNYGEVGVFVNKKVTTKIELDCNELHNYAMMNYWNNDESSRYDSINNKVSMWYA